MNTKCEYGTVTLTFNTLILQYSFIISEGQKPKQTTFHTQLLNDFLCFSRPVPCRLVQNMSALIMHSVPLSAFYSMTLIDEEES